MDFKEKLHLISIICFILANDMNCVDISKRKEEQYNVTG